VEDTAHNDIANATVLLYTSGGDWTGKSDYTDSNGNFRMKDVGSGSYYLTVQKNGYIIKRDPDSGSFVLECVSDRGTIQLCEFGNVNGYVKEGPNPVYGALARLYTSDGFFTGKKDNTNYWGYFQIEDINPGDYYLLISKSGYYTKRDPNSGSFNLACGESENRGYIFITRAELNPPQNLSWYNDNNHPHLTWNASSGSGLIGYNVYRNLGNGYVFIAFVSKPTTHYLDTGVDVYSGKFPPNYAYYYVTAVNPESNPSNIVRVPTNQVYKTAAFLGASDYFLFQNHPNPFNPETEIAFQLPEASKVTLIVYNILGQVVEVLLDSNLEAGYHIVTWGEQNFANGVYFYTLKAGEFTDTKRMLLLK
jgi:hypothetical protein